MMSSKQLGLKRKEQSNVELLMANNSSGGGSDDNGSGGGFGLGDIQEDDMALAFNSNYGVADQNSNGPGSDEAAGSGHNSPNNFTAL